MQMVTTSAAILQQDEVPICPLSIAFTGVVPNVPMPDIVVSDYMSTGKRKRPDGGKGCKRRNCVDFIITAHQSHASHQSPRVQRGVRTGNTQKVHDQIYCHLKEYSAGGK